MKAYKTLKVTYKEHLPVFTMQPGTNDVGDIASPIDYQAKATYATSYSWDLYIGGVDPQYVSWSVLQGHADVSGIGTNQLRIIPRDDFLARYSYYVQCVAKNTGGEAYSNLAEVVMRITPEITKHPEDGRGSVGDNIKFSIGAEYATSYEWVLERYNESQGQYYSVPWSTLDGHADLSGTNTKELTIRPTDNYLVDNQLYVYCIIKNSNGEAKSNRAMIYVTKNSGIVNVTGISLNKTELSLSTSSGSNTSKSTYKLTATITPSNATNKSVTWKSSDPTVAWVDANGNVTALTYGTATITATASNGSEVTCELTSNFYDGVEGYTDGSHETITENIASSICWLADAGITRGYDNGAYFGSYRNTSRRDFVIFLWRYSGKPNATPTKTFIDVSYGKNTDSYKAIAWATSVGIINGYSDGTFRPDDSVTRAQVAVMLWKYAGRPSAAATSTFPDVESGKEGLTDNMVRAINWCNTKGLVKGYSNGENKGKFVPSGNCLRYQMAIIMYRYYDKIA